MIYHTPLRYPGGKRRLLAFVRRLLEANRLSNVQYVEPFAGGAALALALLYEGHAASIHLNDLSRPVFAFWHTVLNKDDELCEGIQRTTVTMEEWHRQRAVYDDSDNADLAALGFAAFFLNRTNRSGIIGGGVIGGKDQAGEWKLDCRFNKDELIRRIRQVARHRDRIHLYQQDALAFTDDIVSGLGDNVLAFYDPPYIAKGSTLYLDNYVVDDHRKLVESVKRLRQPWIVTYDYEASILHGLFPQHRRLSFELTYSTQSRRRGREAMFFANQLVLPEDWQSQAVIPMSAASSRFPVFGQFEVASLVRRRQDHHPRDTEDAQG